MYHTTGFSKDDITEMCALVHATGISSGRDGYPPILGLFKCVVVTLTYLRRNHVQQELAEYYGVSQPTMSRAITAVTPVLAGTLRPFVPTAEDLPRDCPHDSAALRGSGVLDETDPANWIGDKGFVGLGMITPIEKSPFRDLLEWEKEFNTAINRIRWRIEQAIVNLKTWTILHTDYRRPLAAFADTVGAVIGLQFYRAA